MIQAKRAVLLLTGVAFVVTAAGCASRGTPNQQTLEVRPGLPLSQRPESRDSGLVDGAASSAPERTSLIRTDTPNVSGRDAAVAGLGEDEDIPPMPRAQASAINVQSIPLHVFASEVFGNILGLTIKVDPQVTSLQELVTVNTSVAMPPREMYKVARQILSDYGVSVRREGAVTRIGLAPAGSSTIAPLIVSGRALPQVPISHRPVFQLVEMDVIRATDAARWLTTIYGSELKITEDPTRNALLLNGRPDLVRQALAALKVFDRPTMRGRISTRLEPAFLSAEQLADRLTEVLNVQGYSANRMIGSPSSVIVLPVASANSVLIFAANNEAMEYAVAWARELDRANPLAGNQSLFYYQVKNTKASEIAMVLNGGSNATLPAPSAQQRAADDVTQVPNAPAAANRTAATVRPPAGGSGPGQILVDEPRNALIYQGDPAQWERTLLLIKQIDRAPRQVMIEVTIAEVTLGGELNYGLSWFAKNGWGRYDGRIFSGSGAGGNSPASGSGSGLTYLLDVAGINRVALNAFAKDNRVNVLSTPHLLVKSGSEANIDVGTEVPTVTLQSVSPQQSDGNSNLLQAIQYRKTGIILKIKPTVYSDDRVDLDISQEVSEVQSLDTGTVANSPAIFNRSLNTSVSLRDGGSVVMAGLISQNLTHSNSGIPLIKDIPVIGNLFKSRNVERRRTELVLIIVPYIVESSERASQVSEAIINQYDFLDVTPPAKAPVIGPVPSTPVQPDPARRLPPPPRKN